jgi:hypothetical protein
VGGAFLGCLSRWIPRCCCRSRMATRTIFLCRSKLEFGWNRIWLILSSRELWNLQNNLRVFCSFSLILKRRRNASNANLLAQGLLTSSFSRENKWFFLCRFFPLKTKPVGRVCVWGSYIVSLFPLLEAIWLYSKKRGSSGLDNKTSAIQHHQTEESMGVWDRVIPRVTNRTDRERNSFRRRKKKKKCLSPYNSFGNKIANSFSKHNWINGIIELLPGILRSWIAL